MAGNPKSSEPSRGNPNRGGSGNHGWSPDVDETRQQDNPSAERSFHADEHAPAPGKGRRVSKEERKGVPGDTARSDTGRGEKKARTSEKGMRDTGTKGRSGRPSGTKDDSAFTGVDPDPRADGRPG